MTLMDAVPPGGSDIAEAHKPAPRRRVIAALGFALALVALGTAGRQVGSGRVHAIVESMGNWGPVGLALVYIPATVFMFPGTILTLAAGYFFGIPIGVMAVSMGSTIGAAAAFLVGRTIGRDWAVAYLRGRPGLARLDAATQRRGFMFVLLIRLSPLFPFNVLNYALSLTAVRFRDYVLGSWLGMLPGTAMYVYFGSTVDDLSKLASGSQQGSPMLRGLGLAATILIAIGCAWVAKHELERVDDRDRRDGLVDGGITNRDGAER